MPFGSRRPVLRLLAGTASLLAGVLAAHLHTNPGPRAHARFDGRSPPAVAVEPAPTSPDSPTTAPPPLTAEERRREAVGERFARGKVITGRTPHRMLLFTFDDGPDLSTTPRLLDVLDQLGVRAVFFVNTGRMLDDSERGRARAEVVREIVRRGHLVGDHTVDHALLTVLGRESILAQLDGSREIFERVLGHRPFLFRPPGGRRNERTDAILAERGYTQVLWNHGASDHRIHDADGLLGAWKQSLDARGPGGVVLLHDTHEWTVEAVPRLVEEVRRRNCALLAEGEELYDIVDDPAFFFAPRDPTDPSVEAPPAELHPVILAARQAQVRREAEGYCQRAEGHALQPVEDPSGTALEGFYRALRRAGEAKEAGREAGPLVRVTHMGDSGLNRDQLPDRLRQRFQARFGDGGPGFVPVQPATEQYLSRGVRLYVESGWRTCSILDRCDEAAHYGLGGVVATSERRSRTRMTTRTDVSRVELWYGVQPGGGELELRFGDRSARVLPTDEAELDDRWLSLIVPEGKAELVLEASGPAPARAYGVVFETDGPGVVWDTVSMTGAFTRRALEHDREHFARQLHHRRADLVVLHYGGNDLRRYLGGSVTPEAFQAETRELLERVRSARPGVSCLLTGISDHGKSGHLYVRPQHVEALVEAQRRAAAEAGCAFFDAYLAMGGPGSVHRWYQQGLAAGDLVHLTAAGRQRMADMLYEALMAGYDAE